MPCSAAVARAPARRKGSHDTGLRARRPSRDRRERMRAVHDWVIDCDTHITEPGDVWTARRPARFQADAPRIVRDAEGRDSWKFGSSQRIVPVGHTAVAGWKEPFPAAPRNMDEIPAAAHDAKARLA